jgi:hypothetical protein
MSCRRFIAAIALAGLAGSPQALAEKLTGRNVLWTYALCEDVGILGATSARYEAEITRTGNQLALTSLEVIVDSAQLKRASVTVTAGLKITGAGAATPLVRPWFDTLRSASDSSQDFYLPPRAGGRLKTDQAPITLTAGEDPTVTVSAQFKVDGGMCVMGTGTITIDVP